MKTAMRKPYTVEMDLHLKCEVNALDEEEAVDIAIEELGDSYFTSFVREDFKNVKVTKEEKEE